MRLGTLIIPILYLTGLCFTACTNTTYIGKERVIQKYEPPGPAIHVDRFKYGEIFGKADVLFVLDNTVTVEPAIPNLRDTYQDFVDHVSRSPQLNSRMQMVTTPVGRTPPNWAGNEGNLGKQLSELFDPGGGIEPLPEGFPIFTLDTSMVHREAGFMTPLFSVAMGSGHPAFESRQNVPLFLVFFAGHDYPLEITEEELTTRRETFIEWIGKTHGFTQTHALLLGRELGTKQVFPHCNEFDPTPRFKAQLQKFNWASFEALDLCQNEWVDWPETLWKSIQKFKTRMVLSYPPHEPFTMVVRSAVHKYVYGQDYTYNPTTNEIKLVNLHGLEPGGLLEVSYWLKPPPKEFSGSPTPNPVPPEEGK